jgi:hypothetical protein
MFSSFDTEWDNKSSLVMARMFCQTPSHCLLSVIHTNRSSVECRWIFFQVPYISEHHNLSSQSRPITSRFCEPVDIC